MHVGTGSGDVIARFSHVKRTTYLPAYQEHQPSASVMPTPTLLLARRMQLWPAFRATSFR